MTAIFTAENWIAALPEHVRKAIVERMTTVTLEPGETLKNAGDSPDAMFQIESGFLRLLGLHNDGRQFLILIYREGNTFGETPIVGRRPFSHTTIAMTAVRARKVAQADFWELYHQHPEIPESLCRKFANNITKAFTLRELRATNKLRAQIGSMVATITEFCGEPEPDGRLSFSLPITQTDIAEHLEVTRQAVQREVAALKDAGLVEKRDGRWIVGSVAALRRL